jgi:hypothetical protein
MNRGVNFPVRQEECPVASQHIPRQNISEQIEAINLLKLEIQARELLPWTSYDYTMSREAVNAEQNDPPRKLTAWRSRTMSSLSYGSSKVVNDFCQGVIADPTNSGVSFSAR